VGRVVRWWSLAGWALIFRNAIDGFWRFLSPVEMTKIQETLSKLKRDSRLNFASFLAVLIRGTRSLAARTVPRVASGIVVNLNRHTGFLFFTAFAFITGFRRIERTIRTVVIFGVWTLQVFAHSCLHTGILILFSAYRAVRVDDLVTLAFVTLVLFDTFAIAYFAGLAVVRGGGSAYM
jgi:hypothetical protein